MGKYAELIDPKAPQDCITMAAVMRGVCKRFKISHADLIGPNRSEPLVVYRHIAIYLCARLTKNSTSAIARAFGDRTHQVIAYAINRIHKIMQEEPEFATIVNKLERSIVGKKAAKIAVSDNRNMNGKRSIIRFPREASR